MPGRRLRQKLAGLGLGSRWLLGAAVAVIICSFCAVAQANSAAPPLLTWFEFDYAVPVQPLEGLQVVQCGDRDCQAPALLAKTGDCRGEHCLTFPKPKTRRDEVRPRLDCRKNSFGQRGHRCLVVGGYLGDESLLGDTQFFKLAAQFPQQHRESAVIALGEKEGWRNQTWQVTVQADELELGRAKASWFSQRFTGFELGFGLTVASELLVAWGYGRRQGLAPAMQRRLLATLGLLHVVSYPTVWNFITGFDYFQLPGARAFSVACFGIAIVWAALLHRLRDKPLKALIPLALVALAPLFLVGVVVMLFVGYGQQVPLADGLPRWLTVAIAETFAVVYEAVLLGWLNRKALSGSQAGLLSLVANGVSVLLGAIVWFATVHWWLLSLAG